MKRTLYSGILAAAVFAAAADARAQSNVYSLNVGSCFVNLPFYPTHTFFIGPGSDQYGLRESQTATGRSVEYVHQWFNTNMFGSSATPLATLSTHPLRLRMPVWLAALISLPIVAAFLSFVLTRRHKWDTGSS
jgi:hypothetical protein